MDADFLAQTPTPPNRFDSGMTPITRALAFTYRYTSSAARSASSIRLALQFARRDGPLLTPNRRQTPRPPTSLPRRQHLHFCCDASEPYRHRMRRVGPPAAASHSGRSLPAVATRAAVEGVAGEARPGGKT